LRLLAWLIAGTIALGVLALVLILTGAPVPPGTGTAYLVFIPGMPAPRHLPVFIAMNLMIGVLIYALTLDLEEELRLARREFSFPLPGWLGLLLLALADPALTYLASRALPAEASYLLSRLVLLGGIVYWLYRRDHPPVLLVSSLGHRFRARALGIAFLAAFWEIIAGAMSFPGGLDSSSLLPARPAWSAAWGLTTALYGHGFWQQSLEARWGRKGFVAFPWMLAVPLLAPRLPLTGWWREGLVIVSLLYLAAYLFRRTGNLLAPAAFWTLVIFLGALLRFP